MESTLMKSYLLFVYWLFFSQTLFSQRKEMILSGKEPVWKVWLDPFAKWESDTLYLPDEVNLSTLEVNTPTCGWNDLFRQGKKCKVPTTVEEQFGMDHQWQYHGVSWCWRDFYLPKNWQGKKILLTVGQYNHRIEVFVNNKLMGYDAIGLLPYQCDITEAIKYGENNKLTFRITSPGGNRGWEDYVEVKWGTQRVLPTKDFSGIGGEVKLTGVEATHITDVFIKNLKPAGQNRIEVQTTIDNPLDEDLLAEYSLSILEKRTGKIHYRQTFPCVLQKGLNCLHRKIQIPEAKQWDVDSPELYECVVGLESKQGKDNFKQTFGFRVFEIKSENGKHNFYLNGKRIRFRSAVDWGIYASNGLYPEADVAKRSIEAVKLVGHNALNFHRRLGDTPLFENADSLGVYLYEEPGAFHSGGQVYNIEKGRFMLGQMYERIRRMVLRDRNHPSLLIYSLANEDLEWTLGREMGMRIIHSLDDSRLIINSSGGNGGKINKKGIHHIPPYGAEIQLNYTDNHTALSEKQLMESDLRPIDEHNHYSEADSTIVYWGEVRCYAGTFNYPLLAEQGKVNKGYDYSMYVSQNKKLNDLFKRGCFGMDNQEIKTVFDITKLAGKGQYYTNGRLGQVIMTNDHTDGYAINGWSPGPDMPDEWASAIVDQNRNMNASGEEMSYWNRPLQVAIMRQNGKYFQVGDTVRVKICLINEGKLSKGSYVFQLRIRDGLGQEQFVSKPWPIQVLGGETYAQVILPDYSFVLQEDWNSGHVTIEGEVLNDQQVMAEGKEQVLFRNRISQRKRLQDCSINVINWPEAEKAMNEAKISLDPKSSLILVGKGISKNELKQLLKKVYAGTNLILQTDSLMGEQVFQLGLLDKRIETWGGIQTGHWNGNGSSYIETFVGNQSIPSGKSISTRSWEAQGDPKGFYPFSSKYPLRIHGLYVANQFKRNPHFTDGNNVLVTYGEIKYGKGHILLNTSYWIDENTVFADWLFFNILEYYNKDSKGL